MQTFKAGPFTVGYNNGFLRRIRYGNVEVIRMIYLALRDHNWNTFGHVIQQEQIERLSNGFTIRYECFNVLREEKIFKWNVLITGKDDGEITFEITGEALSDILKNRAGLCILHPIKYTAGGPCELTHTDGSQSRDTFPVTISAENPFKDLRSFRWKCNEHWYSLQYEGDAFETEDQRNWCDASYKTFCTPLSIPFPVLLKAGDKVRQKVIFRTDENLPPIAGEEEAIDITVLDSSSDLPNIGIAASTESNSLSSDCITALRELNLHHYRVEVRPFEKDWVSTFTRNCKIAQDIGAPLEVALHISEDVDLEKFCEIGADAAKEVKQIIMLSTDKHATSQDLVNKAKSLKVVFPSAMIGAGTDYNYRELNTNLFEDKGIDFISYSIDPQEHATDDFTIIENIWGQFETVRSARELYPNTKRIHISSLTLRKRYNPAATVAADKILPNEKKADPRQLTEFAAAFTLGSIKALSSANTNSVTFYQSAGSQGVISLTGEKYPVYNVIRQVLSMTDHQVRHTVSSNPENADALLLTNGSSSTLILINYTPTGQLVTFGNNKYVLAPYEIKTVRPDRI